MVSGECNQGLLLLFKKEKVLNPRNLYMMYTDQFINKSFVFDLH